MLASQSFLGVTGMGGSGEDGGRQRRGTGHLQAGQHQLPQVSPPFLFSGYIKGHLP